MPATTCLDCDQLRRLARKIDDVVVLQTGFEHGHAFLRAWQIWRECGATSRLHFIATEARPPLASALREVHRGTACAALADTLANAWPPLTPDLHRLDFDADRVSLLLAVGTARRWLPELQARAQLFVIDRFDTAVDATEWAPRLCRALARLACANAHLSTLLDATEMTPALRSAGFDVEADEADGEVLRATFRPRFKPRGIVPRHHRADEKHAVIVGAGLAGCATAWALARLGWRSSLIDRHPRLAAEASGNFAGLFHGIVHAHDGAHARFNRAAALATQGVLVDAFGDGSVDGSAQGLLQLQAHGVEPADMRAWLARLQLPREYVQALNAQQASALAGVDLDRPAWFFPGGGWLRPAALARYFVQRAGGGAELRPANAVHRIAFADGQWRLFDADDRLIDQAATLVLANAADALRLCDVEHWPVQRVRGQLSLDDQSDLPADQRATLPRLPLSGDGYVLPDIGGTAVFGASVHAGDTDADARMADHEWNLQRLQRLCPQAAPLPAQRLRAQVAWRCVSADGLPIIGAAPDIDAAAHVACHRARDVPRRAGLYLFTALGSRGINWAALGARVLAAQISHTPVPLPHSLSLNVDPARFVLRVQRSHG